MKRRLATILVADVAGYSSLMEADEEGTAARMAACRAIADAEIAKADGRLFKAMGDAVLAEFTSPMNAVHCAVGIRDALAGAEQGRDRPLTMRFGLHLADVLEGDDLIGDGVNLAARIQQAAEPGTIDLSSALFEQIRRILPYAFDDRGEQSFRNITEPVRVYRLRGEMRRHPYQITHTHAAPSLAKRPHSLAVMPFEVRAGDEEVDAESGAFLGNFPQAFTHLALIGSAVHLQLYERYGEAGIAGSYVDRAARSVGSTFGWRGMWAAIKQCGRVGRIRASKRSYLVWP